MSTDIENPPVLNSNDDGLNDPDLTEAEIARDYEFILFGKHIINASPKVVFTFILSVIIVVFSFVFIFTHGQVTVFAPIIAAVIALWVPSPAQHSQSKKDALQSARLLRNNVRMNRYLLSRGDGAFP